MFNALYRAALTAAVVLLGLSILQDVTGVDLVTELNPSTHTDRFLTRIDGVFAGGY